MIGTKTRYDMSWEEILSNLTMYDLLSLAKRYSAYSPDFRLYLPLTHNLHSPQATPLLKKQIVKLGRSLEYLEFYKRQCEPFVESFSLYLLERAAARIGGNDETSKSIRRKKMQTYPFLRAICPRAERLYDSIGNNLGLAITAVLSPACNEYLPPLTLDDSFTCFNKQSALKIGRRFRKLLARNERIKNCQADFLDFLRRIGLEIPENMNTYIAPYEASAEVLPEWSRTSIITTPLREVPSDSSFFETLVDAPVPQKDFLYRGKASITIFRSKDGSHESCSSRGNLSEHEEQDLVNAVQDTFLKYFLIYGGEPCAFRGIYDNCTSCAVSSDGNPVGRSDICITASLPDCVEFKPLEGINLRLVR
jgi:hypothetical protein